MSDLSKDDYKIPSLAAFVLDHQSLVSTYIGQFDKISDAKTNLERKMRTAYFAKYPKRKRGPGLKVDLEKLWSSSKLDNTVEIEGNKTLEASVKTSGRKIRKRLENKNATKEKEIKENESEQLSEIESSCMSDEEDETVDEIAYKLNDEDATEFEQALLSNAASPHILKNGHDLSKSFNRFQLKSCQEARSSGLFINANIHEILSLYHTVLLRKDQHNQAMANVIGLDNIQEFHTELLNKYVNQDIKIEKNLFIELINIFRGINEKFDRKALKVKLHKLYEAADPLDSKIIDILINLINKLPGNILIDEEVKEFELITNYLDTVVSPIFHDPQKKLMYRWLNKATESSGDRYPDGGSCIISQRQISCSTGFCEVKAGYMKNNTVSTHLDLLRLCIFGKDTIDNEDVENVVVEQRLIITNIE
ncbi:hypothetical protein G6F37_012621 [Rhizopus arrhizus]|nr:hypothetical protein G6F38_012518 [Rhizopus arrhizus]KAG1142527.1 hypothetical protein G6F37_012621 [Rhizopus arrhizus]